MRFGQKETPGENSPGARKENIKAHEPNISMIPRWGMSCNEVEVHSALEIVRNHSRGQCLDFGAVSAVDGGG